MTKARAGARFKASATATTAFSSAASSSRRSARGCSGSLSPGTSSADPLAFGVGVMAFAQFPPSCSSASSRACSPTGSTRAAPCSRRRRRSSISASALAWIALGGFAEPWMLYTIAFINGTVLVLDVPSRQQLTYRMVGREDLPNAIALNSTLFNASRIFGPAGRRHPARRRRGRLLPRQRDQLPRRPDLPAPDAGLGVLPARAVRAAEDLAGTREGLAWIRRQPRMLIVLSLVFVISTFCFNFNVTLPVLAKVTLHGHATCTASCRPPSAPERWSARWPPRRWDARR